MQATALRLLLCWIMAVFALIGEVRAENEVRAIRLGEHPDKSRIVLDLSSEIPYALFTLADPYRIVIDLPEVAWSAKSRSARSTVGLVTGYRFGLFQPGNSRLVIDLSGPAEVKAAYFLASEAEKKGQTRLVIDLVAANRETFLKLTGVRRPSKPPKQIKEAQQPSNSKKQAEALPKVALKPPSPPAPNNAAQAMLPSPLPETAPARAPFPSGPAFTAPKPGTPQLKVSRVRTVVIDAGHGGVDPGANTVDGVYEKGVTLDVAKRLRVLLGATGRYRVIMTRDSDVFVRLGERLAVARDSGADLFISIHADSINMPNLRGASVYTLSEQASDKEAEALANKENNSDMIAGLNIGIETDEIVRSILIDLAQRETMNKSVRFAKLLLPQLGKTGELLKNSHRFAGFRVLKAPDVPSVLVELGLLSNQQDVKILTSNSGRQKLAVAIKEAVDEYFRAQPG